MPCGLLPWVLSLCRASCCSAALACWPPRAVWIARQTRSGVHGMVMSLMPSGRSASTIEFTTAGVEAIVPASPTPLTPSRFAAGLSVLYGTLAAPSTLALDPELSAQWRCFVVTAEYLYSVRYAHGATIVPGSTEQGAALEPGVTLLGRRLDLTARGDWERVAAANVWGVGAGVTAYAPDPRLRLNAGFERRWSEATRSDHAGADGGSYWAIFRLTVAVN